MTRVLAAGIALGVLCGAVLCRGLWLPCVARWLDIGQRPRQSDYVFVLPGGEETRPFVAAALVRRGLAKEALVPRTGDTPGILDGTWKPAHEVTREVFERRGTRPDAVHLIGQASTSTYTDALALAEFLETRPGATVAVVTSDYHTRRTRWIFRNVLGDRSKDLYFVSSPNDRFDATMWWRCREGAWGHCSEYAKLAMYFVRYGGWPVWGGGFLLAALTTAALVARRWLVNGRIRDRLSHAVAAPSLVPSARLSS